MGWRFGKMLADEHLLAWGDSTDMKSDKTVYSVAARLAYYKLRLLITRFGNALIQTFLCFRAKRLKMCCAKWVLLPRTIRRSVLCGLNGKASLGAMLFL